MNRWQNFYLTRKWPDEAGKASNQFALSAEPETCIETYQATLLGPRPFTTSSVTMTTRLQQAHFFSEKNTFDWYQYLESSPKPHHFYEHIFIKLINCCSNNLKLKFNSAIFIVFFVIVHILSFSQTHHHHVLLLVRSKETISLWKLFVELHHSGIRRLGCCSFYDYDLYD